MRSDYPTDQDAREIYHRNLPGGLPRDWLDTAMLRDDPAVIKIYALMAFLGICGSLHVDDNGHPTDYRGCALCIARPPLGGTHEGV